ncbi:hypothetical protein EPO34_02345 [Patescibacteria group bacterium]|nr:MAG: hypothetical protein EPO34_02345 [Patescibacteria group bacterium]
MPPLSPLDILYIVLAFCALWVSAAMFWLIFQAAMLVKNFNDVLAEVQDKVDRIEYAISTIRHRFESATGSMASVLAPMERLVDYVIEKRGKKH